MKGSWEKGSEIAKKWGGGREMKGKEERKKRVKRGEKGRRENRE